MLLAAKGFALVGAPKELVAGPVNGVAEEPKVFALCCPKGLEFSWPYPLVPAKGLVPVGAKEVVAGGKAPGAW